MNKIFSVKAYSRVLRFIFFKHCTVFQLSALTNDPYKLRDSVSEFSDLSEFHFFKTTGQLSLHWPAGDCNKLRKQFFVKLISFYVFHFADK